MAKLFDMDLSVEDNTSVVDRNTLEIPTTNIVDKDLLTLLKTGEYRKDAYSTLKSIKKLYNNLCRNERTIIDVVKTNSIRTNQLGSIILNDVLDTIATGTKHDYYKYLGTIGGNGKRLSKPDIKININLLERKQHSEELNDLLETLGIEQTGYMLIILKGIRWLLYVVQKQTV